MSIAPNPPPPPRPVRVTFDKDGDPQFTFVPSTVRVRGRGTVVFQQDSSQAEWRFTTADVKEDTKRQFHPEIPGDGTILHIKDDFKDTEIEAYSYNITVKLDGTPYTSPDPHIVNDPGG